MLLLFRCSPIEKAVTEHPHASLIAHINRKDWWHVPPADGEKAYKHRGKFLASSYGEAEFYGRPDNTPHRATVTNPLVGDNDHIETHLYGKVASKERLGHLTGDAYLKERAKMDGEMKQAAQKKGHDAIALLTPKAWAQYQETKKTPRSIELNVLDHQNTQLKKGVDSSTFYWCNSCRGASHHDGEQCPLCSAWHERGEPLKSPRKCPKGHIFDAHGSDEGDPDQCGKCGGMGVPLSKSAFLVFVTKAIDKRGGHQNAAMDFDDPHSPELSDHAKGVLANWEKDIHRKNIEHMMVMHPKTGKVIHTGSGTDSSCEIPEHVRDYCQNNPGMVLSHNHPYGWSFLEDNLRRQGTGHSKEDLHVAHHLKLGQMRAVSPRYTHIARPPEGGWKGDIEEHAQHVSSHDTRVHSRQSYEIWAKDTTEDEANHRHGHLMAQSLHKEGHLRYERHEHGMPHHDLTAQEFNDFYRAAPSSAVKKAVGEDGKLQISTTEKPGFLTWHDSEPDYSPEKVKAAHITAIGIRNKAALDQIGNSPGYKEWLKKKTSSPKYIAFMVKQAREETHTSPTPAQKEAGNYQKGRVQLHGLTVVIENPKGTIRRGYDTDGNPTWSVKMGADYGYFVRSHGSDKTPYGPDGDPVDVFLGPYPASELVYVIDQVNKEGAFDEQKCVVGARTEAEARQVYLSCYSPGWTGLGAITAMTMPEFKEWLKTADKTKPVGNLKRAKVGPGDGINTD